jgi:DNA-binding GntR family transcriptional regulator
VELARQLGVSRTPVREALNRLAAAGFLSFTPSRGYFRRPLDPNEIYDLYEMRQAIEVVATRLAAERASPAALEELEQFLKASIISEAGATDELVRFDEGFHERVVRLSGNQEMCRCLSNINDRIRFFRWIDMESGRRRDTQEEHRQVLLALRARDAQRAGMLMHGHIERRREQIVHQVREGYARIYVDAGTALVDNLAAG